jgi:hypothetical protein
MLPCRRPHSMRPSSLLAVSGPNIPLATLLSCYRLCGTQFLHHVLHLSS